MPCPRPYWPAVEIVSAIFTTGRIKGVNTSVNGRKGPSIFLILPLFCVGVREKGKSWVRIEVPLQEGKGKNKVGKLNVQTF